MGRFLSTTLVTLAVAAAASAQAAPLNFEIHPAGQPGKCVEVRGGVFANGTPVQVYDCNGTDAQKWFVNPLGGQRFQIQVSGQNFCLDAGANPFQPNGNQMKIWDCYPDLPQQRWAILGSGNIVLTDVRYGPLGTVCLDLTDGRLDNTNVLQTWECTTGNNNQVWLTDGANTSSQLPSFTVSPTISSSAGTPTGPTFVPSQPPTGTDDYPKPGCPVFSCAACQPSYTHTFIAPAPSLCHACACVSTPAPQPTVPFPTPGGEYPRPGCPVFSCPACRPGTEPTFVAPNPNSCHACACIDRAFSVPTSAP